MNNIVYGLKGWYWVDNGAVFLIYDKQGREEHRTLPLDTLPRVREFLQVSDALQSELAQYHDSKGSPSPKSAPLTPRRYRGNLVAKYAL